MGIFEKNRTSSGGKGLSPALLSYGNTGGSLDRLSSAQPIWLMPANPFSTCLPSPKHANQVFAACPRRWQWTPAAARCRVCCMCKATSFPQPPSPALRESKYRQTKAKAHPGAEYTRPVGWAEPLLLPKTLFLIHRTAGQPRGCCGEFLTMLQQCPF